MRILHRPLVVVLVFGVGVVCLVLAPLTRWYVLPRVEVTPLDENVVDTSTGLGTYFDANTLKFVGPVPLTVTRHLEGDVAAGQSSGDAVWNVSTVVDTAESLALRDPRLSLSWTVERWVFDRHTNEPVHCCGETPRFTANAYLKFPFNVRQDTYQYWSPQARRSFPIQYAGTENLSGHQLYAFTGTLPATRMGVMRVPGSLIGEPDAHGLVTVDEYYRDDGTRILVDPLSGIPVGGAQHPRITLRLPGTTKDLAIVFTASFASTTASEQSLLGKIDTSDNQLKLVEYEIPVGALVLGAVAVLTGLVLLISRKGIRSRNGGNQMNQSIRKRRCDEPA